MSDLLSMGSSGVLAYQRALSSVANNIANIATEGYSNQTVDMAAGMPRNVGNDYIGTGVYTTGVRRAHDAFIEANVRNSGSELQGQETVVSYANRLVDLMASKTSGLSGSLAAFFSAARDLGVDPASSVTRSAFLRQAEALAANFRRTSTQLSNMGTEVLSNLNTSADKINTLSKQLLSVNQQLFRQTRVENQPPELLDQRDNLLRDLAKLVRIDTSFAANGQVNVSINGSTDETSGAFLVKNDVQQRFSFRLNSQSQRLEGGLLLDTTQERLVSSLSGGEVGGYLAVREQIIEPSGEQLDTLAKTLIDEVNAVHQKGIDATGTQGKALFGVSTGSTTALGMNLLITDPGAVAAAYPLRVVADEVNVGVAQASLTYDTTALSAPTALASLLAVRTDMPSQELDLEVGELTALGTLSAGTKDAAIYFDTKGQWPQLITRDGRHLLGSGLSSTQQSQLLSYASLQSGATYDSRYLNPQDTAASYLKASYFIGAKASPLQSPDYSATAVDPHTISSYSDVAAKLQGQLVLASTSTALNIPAGHMVLNGVELSAYSGNQNPNTLAAWLNTQSAATGVSASVVEQTKTVGASTQTYRSLVLTAAKVSDEVRLTFREDANPSTLEDMGFKTGLYWDGTVPEDLLVFASTPAAQVVSAFAAEAAYVAPNTDLTINGKVLSITTAEDLSTPEDLVTWINSQSTNTGVRASVEYQGDASVRQYRVRFSATDISSAVTVTAANLGLTAARTDPAVTGANVLKLSAQFESPAYDRLQALRNQPVDVVFGDNNRYTITDRNSATVLAERSYDPSVGKIVWNGLTVQLSAAPVKGDRFAIDNNTDGTGDSININALAALEFEKLSDGVTLTDHYTQQISTVGNVARQASIAKEALQVVFNQATEARQSLVGVSLDEEAAKLIRFQQAYQANAKTIQASNTLFDTLINIR